MNPFKNLRPDVVYLTPRDAFLTFRRMELAAIIDRLYAMDCDHIAVAVWILLLAWS